jgi:hypothetical protein
VPVAQNVSGFMSLPKQSQCQIDVVSILVDEYSTTGCCVLHWNPVLSKFVVYLRSHNNRLAGGAVLDLGCFVARPIESEWKYGYDF